MPPAPRCGLCRTRRNQPRSALKFRRATRTAARGPTHDGIRRLNVEHKIRNDDEPTATCQAGKGKCARSVATADTRFDEAPHPYLAVVRRRKSRLNARPQGGSLPAQRAMDRRLSAATPPYRLCRPGNRCLIRSRPASEIAWRGSIGGPCGSKHARRRPKPSTSCPYNPGRRLPPAGRKSRSSQPARRVPLSRCARRQNPVQVARSSSYRTCDFWHFLRCWTGGFRLLQ
jgi:hypothetical protein